MTDPRTPPAAAAVPPVVPYEPFRFVLAEDMPPGTASAKAHLLNYNGIHPSYADIVDDLEFDVFRGLSTWDGGHRRQAEPHPEYTTYYWAGSGGWACFFPDARRVEILCFAQWRFRALVCVSHSWYTTELAGGYSLDEPGGQWYTSSNRPYERHAGYPPGRDEFADGDPGAPVLNQDNPRQNRSESVWGAYTISFFATSQNFVMPNAAAYYGGSPWVRLLDPPRLARKGVAGRPMWNFIAPGDLDDDGKLPLQYGGYFGPIVYYRLAMFYSPGQDFWALGCGEQAEWHPDEPPPP